MCLLRLARTLSDFEIEFCAFLKIWLISMSRVVIYGIWWMAINPSKFFSCDPEWKRAFPERKRSNNTVTKKKWFLNMFRIVDVYKPLFSVQFRKVKKARSMKEFKGGGREVCMMEAGFWLWKQDSDDGSIVWLECGMSETGWFHCASTIVW